MAESEVSHENTLNPNTGITNVQGEADGSTPEQKKNSFTLDSLREYLKLVEAEERNWKNYTESLMKEYYKLKGDVASKKKMSLETVNYMDYLPDEKEFWTELQKTTEDCSFICKGLDNLNDSIYLMHSEFENQVNLIIHKLNMKRKEFETSLPDDD